MEYRLACWFQITQKHTFLPQTKLIGLVSCLYLCQASSTASLSEIRGHSVYENHFTHITAYKKVVLFKQQPQASPMREPVLTTWADLLSLCLGYSLSSTSISRLPKSCPHILESLGWETPSQLGLQGKSEWGRGDTELTAVPRMLEGEQPTQPLRADHHQPHKPLLQLQGETAQLVLPGCSAGKPS